MLESAIRQATSRMRVPEELADWHDEIIGAGQLAACAALGKLDTSKGTSQQLAYLRTSALNGMRMEARIEARRRGISWRNKNAAARTYSVDEATI